ncbi:metallophosphoesterase [bacterium]|nr:metallophosphoesterase [bacterium]
MALFLLFNSSSVFAKEFSFAQISDVHYSLSDSYPAKYLYFLKSSIIKKNPDFVVFLGDNVAKSREEDVIGFMQSIYSLRLPYYVVLGNTDAHKLSGIEKEIYLDIVTTFNHNQKEQETDYYFQPNKDVICVVLDVTPNFAPSKHGEISDEQIAWLDNLLSKNSKKMFFIFHHCPLVPPRVEYQLSMFNAEKYREMLDKHSNVVLISSGHYRQSAISQDEKGIRHISAPAFEEVPHSYQLIKVIYDKKRFRYPKNIEVLVENVKV